MPSMGGRLGQALSRLGNIRLGAGPATSAAPSSVVGKAVPFLGHLYDNKGKFKRMLDPLLSRPVLTQQINGGYQPITLDLPMPVRQYPDVVIPDVPALFYRAGESSGSLTDLMGTASALAPTALDKSASMSFGNPGAFADDGTTAVKNASAVPTSGYLFGDSPWDVSSPTNWTIEFLFLQRVVGNIDNPLFRHQGYVDGSGNPGNALMIYIDAAGQLQFFIHPPNTGIAYTSATGYAPSLSAWHLLQLVNTNGTYTLYVDGVLRFTSPAATYQATIGQGFQACAHPGSLQELAIYGTSLSGAQITARQAARSAGSSYRSGVTADIPLGYWSLGEPVGSLTAVPTVSDTSLLIKSPTYQQPPLVNDDASVMFGSVGNGGGIGGNSYVTSVTPRPITGTKFAIEAWIQPATLKKNRISQGGEAYIGGRCIVKVGDLASTALVSLTHNGTDVRIGSPGGSVNIANALTTGRHHVVWVHDSALVGAEDTLYIDGLVFASGLHTVSMVPAAGLAIGNDPGVPTSYTAGYGGTIDEVAIYNFAPTAAQVVAHFNAGTDLTQGNLVKLTEQGGGGEVVYTGIVEDLPDFIDLTPTFQIGLQPLVVELADTFFTKNYTSPTDLIQMVRDAVGQTGHLTWSATSMPLSGVLGKIDFTNATALQVVETAKQFLGPNYWWFVDQDGLVWMQAVVTTVAAKWSTTRADFAARRYRSPIGMLKNKVLVIGNIPPNQAVPITSLYNNLASQKRYGVRYMQPPLVYPNVADQATLDLASAAVGAALDRRLTTVELDLPENPIVLLGQDGAATMRYWEPNKNPGLGTVFGAGRYSPTYVVLTVSRDGPFQKLVLGDLPITSNDLQYVAERIQQQQLMNAVLHPGLSGTVPGMMSGGFFSGAVGTLPTLPSGFTGWSLDAQNGLSLYNAGTLIARYGPSGGAGVLQAYSGYQPVSAAKNCRLRFELPANTVQSITKVYLSFTLQPFRATAQSVSDASSASSSSGGPHKHGQPILDTGGGAAGATVLANLGGNRLEANLGIGGATFSPLSLDDSPNHSHPIPHTHAVNTPDGLYETAMAQGVHVLIDGTDRTSALSGPWGSGSTLDVSDLDISTWLTATGWHTVELSSTTLGVIVAQVTTKAQLQTA